MPRRRPCAPRIVMPSPSLSLGTRHRRPASSSARSCADGPPSAVRSWHASPDPDSAPEMRKDVRQFIRRLEAAGLTVEPTPGHYRVLRDDKPLRKANGMPSCSRSPPTRSAGGGRRSSNCASSASTSEAGRAHLGGALRDRDARDDVCRWHRQARAGKEGERLAVGPAHPCVLPSPSLSLGKRHRRQESPAHGLSDGPIQPGGGEKTARRRRATATQGGLHSLPETGASRRWPLAVRRYSLVACPQARQRAE